MNEYVPLNKVLDMMRVLKFMTDNNQMVKSDTHRHAFDEQVLEDYLWLDNHSKEIAYKKDEY